MRERSTYVRQWNGMYSELHLLETFSAHVNICWCKASICSKSVVLNTVSSIFNFILYFLSRISVHSICLKVSHLLQDYCRILFLSFYLLFFFSLFISFHFCCFLFANYLRWRKNRSHCIWRLDFESRIFIIYSVQTYNLYRLCQKMIRLLVVTL